MKLLNFIQAQNDPVESGSVPRELQRLLRSYLQEHPHLSLNALSKKCSVSEPTLRRILKGQIKTLPTTTTILDILTSISGQTRTSKIAELYPGPLADYLKTTLPQAQDCDTEYIADLNHELENPTKYLIFKLSANTSGLKDERLQELFGSMGKLQADHLVGKGYLRFDSGLYRSTIQHFTSSQKNFIANFKCISDFIKVENHDFQKHRRGLRANYSESLSPEAYKSILQIQEKALKKIRNLMTQEESKGAIPVFLLSAVDTFEDLK